MRLVVSSDWHADWSTLGVRRHDEVVRSVNEVVTRAVRERVDAFLFLGDLADPDTGGDTFKAIRMALEVARVLSHAGIPSVWITGNHDVCEDGSGDSVLTPLDVLGDPYVTVARAPRLVKLGSLSLLCLPFTPASHGVDVAAEALRLWPETGEVIVAGHLMLPGIHAGGETLDMPRGREVLFPFEETKRAAVRLNGHYHEQQVYTTEVGPPVYIPGSLARLSFGEEKNEPGYLVIDLP